MYRLHSIAKLSRECVAKDCRTDDSDDEPPMIQIG